MGILGILARLGLSVQALLRHRLDAAIGTIENSHATVAALSTLLKSLVVTSAPSTLLSVVTLTERIGGIMRPLNKIDQVAVESVRSECFRRWVFERR